MCKYTVPVPKNGSGKKEKLCYPLFRSASTPHCGARRARLSQEDVITSSYARALAVYPSRFA